MAHCKTLFSDKTQEDCKISLSENNRFISKDKENYVI